MCDLCFSVKLRRETAVQIRVVLIEAASFEALLHIL